MAEDDPMEIVKKAIQDNAIATEVNSDGKIVSWSVTYGVLSEATKQQLEALTLPLRKARKTKKIEFWGVKDDTTKQFEADKPNKSEMLFWPQDADVIVKWIES